MMKLFYFLTLLSILPVFGLTGCHSDKSLNPGLPTQKEILNPSISYKELNNIKSIETTGFISLDLEDHSGSHSLVKSDCQNNYLEEFSKLTRSENTDSLIVKDILPIQVFTPSLDSEVELFCDFEITILNNQGKNINNSKIVLKDIKIKNIQSYNNFKLPLEDFTKTPGQVFYFHKKDIKNIKLPMPVSEGQVFTLCQDSGRIFSFKGPVFSMIDFIDEKLFEDNNLNLCRFVIHQKSPDKKWVTEAFFIQDQKPKITYQYNHNYIAGIAGRWNGKKMGTLSLSNQGNSVAYLQILPFPTKVSLTAVYSNFSKPGVNHRSDAIVDLNVFWTVDEGVTTKKDGKEFIHIYRLEPRESIELSLRTHDGFMCEYGETIPFDSFGGIGQTDKTDCKKKFYLSGILYHLHAFPKITYNLFSTMDFQKWQAPGLEKLLHPKYDGKFSEWVPNYKVFYNCPGLSAKNELNNYPTQNQVLSHLFECRLNNR